MRFLMLFLILGLAACTSPVDKPATEPSAHNEAEDREAILAQSRALSEAYIAGDIDALVQIYAEDGIAAPGGQDFVQGHAALGQLWALPEGRVVVRHRSEPIELVIDGDHAYDRGHYEGQVSQDGELRNPFGGAYLIVWERGADGVWRIAVDMWYSLPAAQ